MKKNNMAIVNEIMKIECFNLDTYYEYLNRYGKSTIYSVFAYILKQNKDNNMIFDKYFDAFFSIELDDMKMTLL